MNGIYDMVVTALHIYKVELKFMGILLLISCYGGLGGGLSQKIRIEHFHLENQ